MKFFVLLFITTVADAYFVQFLLYTLESQNEPVILGPNNASKVLQNGSETRLLIPGWLTSPTFQITLRPALFSHGNLNVIEVDWSSASKGPYVQAVLATPNIAEQIGDFVLNLTRDGVPLKTIQPIGFSLGAHVAGYLGEYIFNKLGEKLSRITGLDPSGPLFEPPLILNGRHLNKSNADVVLVVHTAMGTAGTVEAGGTVDVYPNGGVGPQPGCPIRRYPFSCSQQRSWMYFATAIANPGRLIAAQCASYALLLEGKCNNMKKIDVGGVITKADEGKYYLMTHKDFPFVSAIPSPL